MTEPDPSAHDERQVRRLLAEARHDAPLPAAVAARLDGVLVDLAGERDAPDAPPATPVPPVVDLAARRRRRQGGALLVAAAAVVAIGVGVGTVVDRGADDQGSAAGGGSSESFDRADDSQAGADSDAAPSQPVPSLQESDGLARMRPVAVSSDTFAADAERYRGLSLRDEQSPGAEENDPGFACDVVGFGAGVLVPVLYDGTEAVLAYRPPTDDAQVVDLLQCGTADILRTTTLPVP